MPDIMQKDTNEKVHTIELKKSNAIQQLILTKFQFWVRRRYRFRKWRPSRGCRVGTNKTCMKPWAMHSIAGGANHVFMDRDAKTDTSVEDASTGRFQW